MHHLYRGQSLLALMVSLALSSFLLLVIISFYSNSQQQNHRLFLQLRLQNELQRTLQLIGKDLRRAGFRALAEKLTQTNEHLFEQDPLGKSLVITHADQEAEQSCVLFFYDLDASGCIGSTYKSGSCVTDGHNTAKTIERELFGYRLSKGMIETRATYKSAVDEACTQAQCQSYLHQPACNSGGWTDLLDANDIQITQFSLNWLIENSLLEVKLQGKLKRYAQIHYATSLVVPLPNQAPSSHLIKEY